MNMTQLSSDLHLYSGYSEISKLRDSLAIGNFAVSATTHISIGTHIEAIAIKNRDPRLQELARSVKNKEYGVYR